MTVEELFNCFSYYFDKIIYFCDKEKVEETIMVTTDTRINKEYDEKAYFGFLNKYANYYVFDWYYDTRFNTISISI